MLVCRRYDEKIDKKEVLSFIVQINKKDTILYLKTAMSYTNITNSLQLYLSISLIIILMLFIASPIFHLGKNELSS